MGLLDGFFSPKFRVRCRPFLAGTFFFFVVTQLWGLLSTIPRRGVFLPKFGVCCAAFLSRAFFFVFTSLSTKSSYCVKKMIAGPDFLRNDAMWSDGILFYLL